MGGTGAKARSIANLLGAGAAIPREKLCIRVSCIRRVPHIRGGGGLERNPIRLQVPVSANETRLARDQRAPPGRPSVFQASPHTFLVPRGYLSRYDAIYDARSALVSQFEPDVITKIESRVTGRTGRESSRLEERPVKELLNPRGFVINLVGRASRNVEPTPTGFGKRWNRRKRRTRTI